MNHSICFRGRIGQRRPEGSSRLLRPLSSTLALFTMHAFAPLVPAKDKALSIKPVEIQVGEAALLSWAVEGNPSVYLSGIGRVPPSGSRKVMPTSAVSYFLLAENGTNISVHNVRVNVTGARGDDGFPKDLNQFRYPISTKTEMGLVDLLDRLRDVMQNTLQFSLREMIESAKRIVIITNLSERASLLDGKDKAIGARRLAFRVDVSPPSRESSHIHWNISTMVDYRKRIEKTWRTERDEKMYRAQADLLNSLLKNPQAAADRG